MSTDPPPTLLDILQQTFPQWQIHQDPLSGKWTADRLTPETPLTREVGIPQRLEASALEDLSPYLSQWTCRLSTLPSTGRNDLREQCAHPFPADPPER